MVWDDCRTQVTSLSPYNYTYQSSPLLNHHYTWTTRGDILKAYDNYWYRQVPKRLQNFHYIFSKMIIPEYCRSGPIILNNMEKWHSETWYVQHYYTLSTWGTFWNQQKWTTLAGKKKVPGMADKGIYSARHLTVNTNKQTLYLSPSLSP